MLEAGSGISVKAMHAKTCPFKVHFQSMVFETHYISSADRTRVLNAVSFQNVKCEIVIKIEIGMPFIMASLQQIM